MSHSSYAATIRRMSPTVMVAAAAILLASLLAGFGLQAEAGEAVLLRGIVKSGGDASTVNVYVTHVATAPDASKLQGQRFDVKVSGAKKFKWQTKNGALEKVRTTANATPEKEVVISGTFLPDEDRIVAAWIVQNYREFHIEGKLQARELDNGSIDEGYVTVNVTKSVMRGVSPERNFKSTALVGKDLRVRINGSSIVRSIGTSADWSAITGQTGAATKSAVEIHLDEVSESQQSVVLEGQMTDEDNWTASQYYQRNT